MSTGFQNKLDSLIFQAIGNNNMRELTIGFLRYETLRKLNSFQYKELCEKNLKGEVFDEMVDELVIKDNKKNPCVWACPHCNSNKGTWFSRTTPMGNVCENCGKSVD